MIKVHPHTHGFEELRTGTFNSDNEKCKKGEVRGFKRAIPPIRNQFDSIWSVFQRRVTKSHISGHYFSLFSRKSSSNFDGTRFWIRTTTDRASWYARRVSILMSLMLTNTNFLSHLNGHTWSSRTSTVG